MESGYKLLQECGIIFHVLWHAKSFVVRSYVDSKDPDQTAYLCSLIWIFAFHLQHIEIVEHIWILHTSVQKHSLSTGNSSFLEVQGTLKYFEISVPRHVRLICRIEEKINQTTSFHKCICNFTPELEIDRKYCEKEEKLLLFSTIFCYLLPEICLNRDQIFTSK